MNEFSFYYGKFRIKVFRSVSGWQWVARSSHAHIKSSQVFETWRQAENNVKDIILPAINNPMWRICRN